MTARFVVQAQEGEARFLSHTDAELYARALAIVASCTVPAIMDSSDTDELPLVLYDCSDTMLLAVASFSSEQACRLGEAVMHHFRNRRYTLYTESMRYAPLNMSSIAFLEDIEAGKDGVHPYDLVEDYLKQIAAERELDEFLPEFECFLASAPIPIGRRDTPRWKDIFRLVFRRMRYAMDYPEIKIPMPETHAWEEFLSWWNEEDHLNASVPMKKDTRKLRKIRKILIDADGCPVVHSTEKLAERYGIPSILFCDETHTMASVYSTVIHVPKGAHAADWAIVNHCHKGDIVVTQDFGLAAMVLAKEAYPIHPDGWRYTAKTIGWPSHKEGMPYRGGHPPKHGGRKRMAEDDEVFEHALERLIHKRFLNDEEDS